MHRMYGNGIQPFPFLFLPQNPMRLLAFLSLLALVLHEAGTASLPGERKREEQSPTEGDTYPFLHMGNYALNLEDYSEVIDLSSYEEPADYGDQISEAKVDRVTLPTRTSSSQSIMAPKISSSNLTMTGPTTSDLLNSQSSHAKLKRIDLSSNSISSIHNDAFCLLPALQDLILPENQLAALPVLPSGIEFLDVRLNRLQSSGIQPEAFVALEKLQFLYLADNLLDSIPGPLPLSLRSLHLQNNMIKTMERDTFCDTREHRHEHRRQLEDIRLDGNPINLSLFPEAYFCLPRLPVGRFT
ncbi:opticin isoform X2 [Cricetulus griseus]|uniref:Opticin isoform X2 n=1 Tax=Cricetulus griseus TaxID=10029 RepID=A0A9J7JS79_CRIGR|nr:opticin isoform X2 [Cricetulus griseus]XP_027273376.1 opticin isoform X2 [Cricetulus griseus]